MVKKRLDARWSSILMPYEYCTARPFEYRTNGHHLVFKYWSGIQMVGQVHKTKPIDKWFEYQTIWKPNFKKFVFKCFRYSVVLLSYNYPFNTIIIFFTSHPPFNVWWFFFLFIISSSVTLSFCLYYLETLEWNNGKRVRI